MLSTAYSLYQICVLDKDLSVGKHYISGFVKPAPDKNSLMSHARGLFDQFKCVMNTICCIG